MAEAGAAHIGFVGIGNMGTPMAECLLKAGHDVSVFDAQPGRAAAFAAQHGAAAPATLNGLAAASDIVITMLPDSGIVGRVLFGEGDNVAGGLKRGALVIEMSSGVPGQTIGFAEKLAKLGADLIDAPVSGGVARAVTGDLAIMVGGAEAAILRAEPVLRAMGSTILRAGALGSGQAVKALNNLVSAAGLLATVEALLVGAKFGLDPAVMVDVLNASSGMTNSSQRKIKQFVLSRSFGSGFGLDLMVKDLTIALEVARDTKTAVPLSALCREMWLSAAQMLGPGEDHTAITKMSELFANAKLGGN
jgi:3-hydroxyisobutyrate dehydrogenase